MMAGAVARVALPVNLSRTDHEGWEQGLQRLEVDTAAGTLRALGLAGARDGSGYAPLTLERSVQIGDTVYYLGAGALTAYPW